MREIPMALRVAGALTALIGLAAFTGDAAAQYDSYRYPYVPGPYRGAPYLADDDDDLGPPRPRREIPGGTRREATPYPSETRPPYDRRYEQAAPVLPRPSDVERQPLYDPYQPYRRAPAQGDYATRPQDPPPVI